MPQWHIPLVCLRDMCMTNGSLSLYDSSLGFTQYVLTTVRIRSLSADDVLAAECYIRYVNLPHCFDDLLFDDMQSPDYMSLQPSQVPRNDIHGILLPPLGYRSMHELPVSTPPACLAQLRGNVYLKRL